MSREVRVGSAVVGGGGPLALIAGPCVIEGREMALEIARLVARVAEEFGIPAIFKASFDKANRMSLDSFRGPGMKEGLEILGAVKAETGLPVVTDVHSGTQAEPVAEVVDLLQIPAFLCRQTDVVVAAAETGKPLLIKKGQFMAPEDMGAIVGKATANGEGGVLLAERGTTFGYHNLVVDMKGLSAMRRFGWPVVFDATHAVQLPGGAGGSSGGQREFIPTLARAAAGAGVEALFVEVHPDPTQAKSDRDTQLPLAELPELLKQVLAVDGARRAVMEGSPE
ncbi:MAG TPA: 3-deoxy-8-phosphooctulonate synthase [Armatimonadota bacterium]|nr:3-deoxy-8-phosphooctulonate synthase [Armatimonadota bacterium]